MWRAALLLKHVHAVRYNLQLLRNTLSQSGFITKSQQRQSSFDLLLHLCPVRMELWEKHLEGRKGWGWADPSRLSQELLFWPQCLQRTCLATKPTPWLHWSVPHMPNRNANLREERTLQKQQQRERQKLRHWERKREKWEKETKKLREREREKERKINEKRDTQIESEKNGMDMERFRQTEI